MNKIFWKGVIFSLLILPLAASAASQITVQSITTAIVNTVLYVASAVVIILWIITGILFLTAQGAPDKLIKARNALIAAAAGTALIIIANSAVYLVGQAIGVS